MRSHLRPRAWGGAGGSRLAALVSLGAALIACGEAPGEARGEARGEAPTIVFKHQPLWGAPEPFAALLAEFERQHPEITVVTDLIPNDSDVAHQLFLTALDGGARDFDLFVADVVWVQEFARAGWISDLSSRFPPELLRAELSPGAVATSIFDERTYALPWFVDVGLLYFRTDLVPRPPRTYAELETLAAAAMAQTPGLFGFLWQGRQYEGLNCNVYEELYGHGGTATADGRVLLDTPEMRAALTQLRGFIVRGISPETVTSAAEEETRRLFQQGRAAFMRNWPYAFAEAQAQDSPVRGKVGFASLPTASGAPGAGILGGWQLVVNANVAAPQRQAAMELAAFLTSPEAELVMALRYGRIPPRPALYDDPRLRAGAPFIAALRDEVERAQPRPVTPYYSLLTDTLQGEFSAAVSGLRSPARAMARAQRFADHLTNASQTAPSLRDEAR